MTGYTSRLRALYRNVFLAILFFMAAIFAIIFFLMKPKVKIDFITGSEFSKPISSVYYDRGEFLTEEILQEYNRTIGIHDRPGYIFEGWEYNSMLIDLDTRFLVDVQLNASWVAKKYDVEFDLNGGEYILELDLGENTWIEHNNNFEVSYRQAVGLPPIPTSSGFVKDRVVGREDEIVSEKLYTKELVGWKVDRTGTIYNSDSTKNYVLVLNDVIDYNNDHLPEDLEGTLTFEEKVEHFKGLKYGKVVLKAEWRHKEIKITVLGEGENEEGKKIDDFEYLAINHKMAENVLEEDISSSINRLGYKLEGLYYKNDLTQPIDFGNFAPDEDIEIYANWEEGVYNVWFDALNGGVEPGVRNIYPEPNSVIELEYGQLLSAPAETPQLNGYQFDGWYLNYDFNAKTYGDKFDFENDLIGEDTTLYARWQEDTLDFSNEHKHSQYYKYEPYTYNENGETINGWQIVGFKGPGDEGYKSDDYLQEPKLIIPSSHPTRIGEPVLAVGFQEVSNELSYLKEIQISSSIKFIHSQAFWQFPSLERILVDTNNTNYDDDNRAGVLYNKDRTVLIKYPAGKPEAEYVVGEEGRNVKEIYPYAFYGNQYLKDITLNVEKIGGGAFQRTAIENVVITSAVKFAEFGLDENNNYVNVFRNTSDGGISIQNINTNDSQEFEFENGALYGGTAENKFHTLINYFVNNNPSRVSFTVNDETEVIKDYAFENSNLQSITLSKNVKELGIGAFRDSLQLTVLNFKDNSNTINFDRTENGFNRYILFGTNASNLTIVAQHEVLREILEDIIAEKKGWLTGEGQDGLITIVDS